MLRRFIKVNTTFYVVLLFLALAISAAGAAYTYRWPLQKFALKVLDVHRPKTPPELGHGGPANELTLFHPGGIVRHPDGSLYISDRGWWLNGPPLQGGLIWRIGSDGIARAVAGSGRQGGLPLSGPALDADLRSPEAMLFDPQGRLLFVDHMLGVIARIEADGTLTRVAGTGETGYSGDGGPALDATFDRPFDIVTDAAGNLYIGDARNHAVRIITPDGMIDTFAGTGTAGYSGDGGPAKQAQLNNPYNLAVDPEGRLLIGDSGNHVIRRVDRDGIISTIAGSGEAGYAGDGRDARKAKLCRPEYMQVLGDRLYFGDEYNNAIRTVDANGIITTVIGNGAPGYSPDGTLASEAQINDPEGFLVAADGTMLVLDSRNHRVLRIDEEGRISTFAGQGRETENLGLRPQEIDAGGSVCPAE